ncbi:MAG: transporter ATP-binding protein [Herbinix sp.]|nr:transporter ATP-binding protein [Herbinix sp.]
MDKFAELHNISFSYGSDLKEGELRRKQFNKNRIVKNNLDDNQYYKTKDILNHVNYTFDKGYSYALIGKSGVGKSTLLHLLAGFIKPTTGSIVIDGQLLEKPRRKTSFLFQDLGLFPWQTVYEAVSMPAKIKLNPLGEANERVEKKVVDDTAFDDKMYKNKWKEIRHTKEEISESVMELLGEMGLKEHKEKYPHELSGGERQRVALARALIGKPDFILMDEPTSALDSMTKELIQRLILKQQQKGKATVLFVTHDIEEAVLLGERILLLGNNGTMKELKNPFYGLENAKEQLGFYEICIMIRKLLQEENSQ